jgi:hypothetical protein
MDERERTPEGGAPLLGDEELARLLAAAGPRPEVPAEDLAVLTAAARVAWRAKVAAIAQGRQARRPVSWALAAGLAALLAVSIGVVWWWSAPPPSRVVAWVEPASAGLSVREHGRWRDAVAGEGLTAGTRLRTLPAGDAPAALAVLRLAGGVSLQVDGGSLLRLAAADSLELDAGAIYVDTDAARGERAALLVTTPIGVARDVGTQFSVRLVGERSEEAMRVRVRSGAVAVEQRAQSWLAAAGQEVTLHRDGRVERRAVAPGAVDWPAAAGGAGGFVLEGSTVGELLAWVARETGWQVRYEDPQLAAAAERIVLHGELRALPADQAAFVLLPGAGLEGELRDGELRVRRRGG